MPRPVPKSSPRAGRPTSRPALTRLDVIRAAITLIDSHGQAAFSMRTLGQSLHVQAMALYNHFPDKNAILDAVADHTFAQIPPPSSHGPWKKRLVDLCRSVRTLAITHPHLFRLAMTRPSKPANALPLVEAALAMLADAGLPPKTQARAYHTLVFYIRGFCLWEIENAHQQRESALQSLSTIAPLYPLATAAAKWIFTPDLDTQFLEGLDLILDGLTKPKR